MNDFRDDDDQELDAALEARCAAASVLFDSTDAIAKKMRAHRLPRGVEATLINLLAEINDVGEKLQELPGDEENHDDEPLHVADEIASTARKLMSNLLGMRVTAGTIGRIEAVIGELFAIAKALTNHYQLGDAESAFFYPPEDDFPFNYGNPRDGVLDPRTN